MEIGSSIPTSLKLPTLISRQNRCGLCHLPIARERRRCSERRVKREEETRGKGRSYIDLLHERQVYYLDVYKRTCMNKIRIVLDSSGIDSNSRGEIKRSERKTGECITFRDLEIGFFFVRSPFIPGTGYKFTQKSPPVYGGKRWLLQTLAEILLLAARSLFFLFLRYSKRQTRYSKNATSSCFCYSFMVINENSEECRLIRGSCSELQGQSFFTSNKPRSSERGT